MLRITKHIMISLFIICLISCAAAQNLQQGKIQKVDKKEKFEVLRIEEAAKKLAVFFKNEDYAIAFFKSLAKGYETRVKRFENNLNNNVELQRNLIADPVATLARAGILNVDSQGGVDFHFNGNLVDIDLGIRTRVRVCRWKLECDTCLIVKFHGRPNPTDPDTWPEIITFPCHCTITYVCNE